MVAECDTMDCLLAYEKFYEVAYIKVEMEMRCVEREVEKIYNIVVGAADEGRAAIETVGVAFRDVYGPMVGDRVLETLRIRFSGREREVGIFVRVWDDHESTRSQVDLLRYGGIPLDSVLMKTEIDGGWLLNKVWNEEQSECDTIEMIGISLDVLYGEGVASTFKWFLGTVKCRFYHTKRAIRSIIEHEFGGPADWERIGQSIRNEPGDHRYLPL